MNMKMLTPIFFTFLLASVSATAAEGKVTIFSPVNDAMVSQHDDVKLSYKAIPGPDGDHLHLNVDGKRADVIHQLEGNADVGMLPVGKHHICLAVNTKAHIPTGIEGCVDITSK
jgi:hypothetical protein